MPTPNEKLRDLWMRLFSAEKVSPPLWNSAYEDWAPTHVADWWLSRTIPKAELVERIKGMRKDEDMRTEKQARPMASMLNESYNKALDDLLLDLSNPQDR